MSGDEPTEPIPVIRDDLPRRKGPPLAFTALMLALVTAELCFFFRPVTGVEIVLLAAIVIAVFCALLFISLAMTSLLARTWWLITWNLRKRRTRQRYSPRH
jgi:predicted lysophospholipase L1 biosynthesis ABC-type transport system permease subunit